MQATPSDAFWTYEALPEASYVQNESLRVARKPVACGISGPTPAARYSTTRSFISKVRQFT